MLAKCNKNLQVDSFTYIDGIISKDSGCSEYVKIIIAKVQVFFFAVEIFLEE